MRSIFRFILIVLFVFTLSAFPALAATIHVPIDLPNIQLGIDVALNGDIVMVAPGTY